MKQPPYFEPIRDESERRWRQLEADPDLAAPWRMLFEQVQDPRHLLSELFQNADDAGARQVEVRLSEEALEVRHDGRDFTESDLRTLCKFASSNKRTLTTIGFRGIGFKSVFAAGPTVTLRTPTLSLRFEEQRFTLPVWEEDAEAENEVAVRVPWRSASVREAVAESLERWRASPAGLLFFRSVSELRFDGLTVRKTRLGDGPVPESEDFGLEREADGEKRQEELVTIFRSRAMRLPADCRREIEEARRAEGNLGEAELRVELVLGLREPQRLHSVLPTDATWAYPFSCNAPFMLTPDRSRLKDPSDSPTNRWLLDEAGRLAAQALAGWVGNGSRSLVDRADAYRLLPVGDQRSHALGESAATRVRLSFLGELGASRLRALLRVDGSAGGGEDTVALPRDLLSVWEIPVTMGLLGAPEKVPLAAEVPDRRARVLQDLGMLTETSNATWQAALAQRATLPRPATWEALAHLWAWAGEMPGSTEVRGRYSFYEAAASERLAIFPVAGKDYLVRKDGLVRPPERPAKCDPAAWEELLSLLRTLDPGWPEWLDRDPGESKKRRSLAEAGSKILKEAKLDGSARLATLFERAAEQLFGQQADRARAIRLTRLLAAAEMDTPDNWRWWNGAGELCGKGTPLLSGVGDHDDMLPEGWLTTHGISPDYFDAAHPEFLVWARSERSGLLAFPLPLPARSAWFHDQGSADAWAKSRGGRDPVSRSLRSAGFEPRDWDFDPALWDFWRSRFVEDRGFALPLVRAIFSASPSELRERATARVVQTGTAYEHTVAGNLRARWLEQLREGEWLPDEFGRPARPEELFRKTKETQAFAGIERFVHPDLDQAAHAELLDLLGVQKRGRSAGAILDRLESIATTAGPALPELAMQEARKWLEALDRFLSDAGPDELESARLRFATNALIPDEERIPRRSGELVRENPEHLPVPVTHRSLERPMLWERLGIRSQPTEEELLQVAEGLPEGAPLAEVELGRARRILARFPQEVLRRTGRWLDATGAMRSWRDLCHATSEPGGKVAHLFLANRRKVADLSMLSPEVRASGDFRSLEPIDGRLSDRALAQGPTYRTRDAGGLCALGRLLAALAERGWPPDLRALGARLGNAGIPIFEELRAAPFLDGEQVGEAHPVAVAWDRDRLVLRAGREAVQDRELALFLEGEVRAALGTHARAAELARDVVLAVGRPESYVEELFAARYGIELPEREPEIDPGPPPDGGEEEEIDPDPGPDPEPGPVDPEPPGEPDDADPNRVAGQRPRQKQDPIDVRLARALGFEKVGATFRSPGGDRELRRLSIEGEPLPWEIARYPRGEVLFRLCVVEPGRRGDLVIAAEQWGLLEGCDSHRLIVLTKDGDSRQYSGSDLARLKKEGRLEVFAAKYRLRFRSEPPGSVGVTTGGGGR